MRQREMERRLGGVRTVKLKRKEGKKGVTKIMCRKQGEHPLR